MDKTAHRARLITTLPSITIALVLIACNSLTTPSPYLVKRLDNPPRTQVFDSANHWLATFTDSARTVTIVGTSRTFSETTAANPVIATTWVRVLPSPFNGHVDYAWLTRELADSSPDVLAIAMEYIESAPPETDDSGLQIAGKASYGPMKADGTREQGADFNDYLGVAWNFVGGTRTPQARFLRSLDCSGFVRMVWGYRSGLSLAYKPDHADALPRHSWELAESAPGIIVVSNSAIHLSLLAPGDLVFFDAKDDSYSTRIDHVGIFLGVDTAGHYRFISSRQTINGPTMGDKGGASILDGKGLYARSFRMARRF